MIVYRVNDGPRLSWLSAVGQVVDLFHLGMTHRVTLSMNGLVIYIIEVASNGFSVSGRLSAVFPKLVDLRQFLERFGDGENVFVSRGLAYGDEQSAYGNLWAPEDDVYHYKWGRGVAEFSATAQKNLTPPRSAPFLRSSDPPHVERPPAIPTPTVIELVRRADDVY